MHKLRHRALSAVAGVVVFVTTYALILPAITMETGVYCGIEEHSEHSVEAGCYEAVSKLVCTESSEGHLHDESCYGTERVLICSREECEGHSHDDACYAAEAELSCGLEENEAHTHSDACYTESTRPVCTLEENEGHSHGDACYEERQVLLCLQEESAPHEHTEACYETEWVLTCERQLHTHGLSCYSNPEADLEDAAAWQASVSGVRLTGEWRQDLVSVAASQLGYRESGKNYSVDEDGGLHGYNRYSAWYGSCYDDWSVHFADFCVAYARVETPTAGTAMEWLRALETRYHAAGNYTPVAGDLVFLDKDGDYTAERMGIISQTVVNENGGLSRLITIEGDVNDAVRTVEYTAGDRIILGYGELPENPNYTKPDAEAEAAGNDSAPEEEPVGETAEDGEEAADDAEAPDGEEANDEGEAADGEEAQQRTLSFEGGDYVVTAVFTAEAEIPEEAELLASEYERGSEPYAERYRVMAELYGWTDSGYRADVRIFNIGFFVDGTEIEPAAPVSITIKYISAEPEAAAEYEVVHFGEAVEVIDTVSGVEADGETISFETEGFSDFGVLALSGTVERDTSEGDLLAYFTFDWSTQELTGNAQASVNGNAGWTGTVPVTAFTNNGALDLSGSHNGGYLTVTKSDGSALLAGYDEVSFDYWVYVTAVNGNGWPVMAAQNGNSISYLNEYYLGMPVNGSSVAAERFVGGRNSDGSGSATVSTSTLNRWIHVRADYNKNNTVLTLYDENGNLIGSQTSTSANKSITGVLQSGSVLYVGKANWNNGEYLNGYIDELKIYGRSTSHVCAANEIAHASFDGTASNYWNETAEETGRAQVVSHMNNSNNLNGNVLAPVDSTANVTHPCSAYMTASDQDYITIRGSGGGNLLKGQSYGGFTVDFWAQAQYKSGDYGLFAIGSNDGGAYRELSAEISGSNTSKVVLQYMANGAKAEIDCGQSLLGKMVRYTLVYDGSKKATLYIRDENGALLGSGTVNVGVDYAAVFGKTNEVVEFGRNAYDKAAKSYDYFNGYMDDIKIYSSAITPTLIEDGTVHPTGAKTYDVDAQGVVLVNIDAGEKLGQPIAGVTYTVYNPDGSVAGSYTTGNEYVMTLEGLRPGVNYTIKQTAVPEGYTVVEQETQFTIPNTADNVYEIGIFFAYNPEATYRPDKTAEVYDYANRIYDIEMTAFSGDFNVRTEGKNYIFVVDQSNSMLFPSNLYDTGKTVNLAYTNDLNPDTNDDASGNSARLDALGLDENQVYYIVADESRTATVFAVWKSSNGYWYCQDASYYCQAQMGTMRPDNSGVYQYADVGHANNTAVVDGGGCINGVERGESSRLIGTAFQVDFNGVTGQRNYKLYTGSTMNRLTYLKYALKKMVYQLAAMGTENNITITTFDKDLESCMTRTVCSGAAYQQNILDLVDFVDHIRTDGGTSQNYGLWHVVNGNPTAKVGEAECSGGHLGNAGDNFVVMITDGALNGDDSASISGGTQEEDLYAAANVIRQNSALITIGLSVQNVTLAQKDLADAPGGIATPGFSFTDHDADYLSVHLMNSLLGEVVKLEGKESTGNITDYISDSFYVTDKDGNALPEGQWLTLQGDPVDAGDSSAAGQLKHDSTGWYIEWQNQTLPKNVTGAEPWRGRVYVKAKEDFIGGNTIDTNKQASIQFNGKPGGTLELETPTVNVRLLPMNEVSSEETIFLSDKISVEEKVKVLLEQLRIQKIVVNGDAVHNKSAAEVTEGLEDDVFTPAYAAGSLSDAQWAALLAGESVTLPYTYDNASSHGAVGYFTIALEQTGESSSLTGHESSETGFGVETYTWRVTYTAERIDGGSRPDNVHNRGNGPGTEVGSSAGTTLETGLGTVQSTDSHVVNVVDGKLTIKKRIDESLVDPEAAQEYTFTLYRLNADGEYERYVTPDGEQITVSIPAEGTEAEVTTGGLARGTYRLEETANELYHVEELNTIAEGTNCLNEAQSKTELSFTIGTDEEGNDVIIWNTASGYLAVYSSLAEGYASDSCSGVSYETAEVYNKKTEYTADLPVTKYWRGVSAGEYSGLDVYVVLCKDGAVETDENGAARALVLNAANNWTGSFKIPLTDRETTVEALGYTVMELSKVSVQELDGTHPAVVENLDPSVTVYYAQARNEGLVRIGAEFYSVETGTDTKREDYALYVTNGASYHLPDAGGIGIKQYTMGGYLLMGVSLAAGLTAAVRKRKEGRKSS